MTSGDCRCIAAGHLSRLAIWHLRHSWQRELPVVSRLAVVSEWMKSFGGLDYVLRQFDARAELVGNGAAARINETPPADCNGDAEFVSF